jgi:hypothetical protein
MSSLEVLLLKGSQGGGDPSVKLEDLRYEILVNGVPSNGDGMVGTTDQRRRPRSCSKRLQSITVRAQSLRLAHTAQCHADQH